MTNPINVLFITEKLLGFWMYDFEGLDNLLIYSILIISMFEFDITNLNL